MSDAEARVLAACEKITVNGQEYRLRPVVVQHLCDLEREALRYYRQQYLQAFADNAGLLGSEQEAKRLIREKLEEAAKWDTDDLPQKTAYSASELPINDTMRRWASDTYGLQVNGEATDNTIRALVSNAVDAEEITPEKIREMSGFSLRRGRVRYDQWWITGTAAGMVALIHSSVRMEHPTLAKEDIASWPFTKIIEAARLVESITAAKVGNT